MSLFDLSDPLVFGFDVIGLPRPQGSVRAFVNKTTGKAQIVQGGSADARKALGSWREAVAAEARDCHHANAFPTGTFGIGRLLDCPVQVPSHLPPAAPQVPPEDDPHVADRRPVG